MVAVYTVFFSGRQSYVASMAKGYCGAADGAFRETEAFFADESGKAREYTAYGAKASGSGATGAAKKSPMASAARLLSLSPSRW